MREVRKGERERRQEKGENIKHQASDSSSYQSNVRKKAVITIMKENHIYYQRRKIFLKLSDEPNTNVRWEERGRGGKEERKKGREEKGRYE